jgi:CBS domain-containing protein
MRRNEPISKIMTANPVSVHTAMALSEARLKMAEVGSHHMPVVSGKKLIGILSSSDLLRVSYDDNSTHGDAVLDHTQTIEGVMHKEPVTVDAKATVRKAAEILAGASFHALPVVDNGNLVGIVTSTDLIQYLVEQY